MKKLTLLPKYLSVIFKILGWSIFLKRTVLTGGHTRGGYGRTPPCTQKVRCCRPIVGLLTGGRGEGGKRRCHYSIPQNTFHSTFFLGCEGGCRLSGLTDKDFPQRFNHFKSYCRPLNFLGETQDFPTKILQLLQTDDTE